MKNVDEYKVEITTGQYITAPVEQKLMIKNLLGEDVEYNFEIYFHWYNMIHELGHAVFEYNCSNRPHPVDEEQYVNNFAIAYWRHYGEIEKLETVCSIVHESLSKFIVPTHNNKNHLVYAKEQWGKDKVDEMMPYKVIEDAKKILCSWGITLPKEINVVLSDDPNCHMCQSKRICAK